MAELRKGKPYIWATWVSKLLGGNECLWSAWFKAHYQYSKYEEEEAGDLVRWSKEHDRMMLARKEELEEAGWEVTLEGANEFKLEGEVATVAGKPDLVAMNTNRTRIIDGKTGRSRDADWWQVLLYMLSWGLAKKKINGQLEGEVLYKQGDRVVSLTLADVEKHKDEMVAMIKKIGGAEPPARRPSRDECKRCNIGPVDCPDRVGAKSAARTSAF